MQPLWQGLTTLSVIPDEVYRASLYYLPPHLRTLLVDGDLLRGGVPGDAEPCRVSLPPLYFLVLRRQNPCVVYLLTGRPGWRPGGRLHQFPWPNRLHHGGFCLGTPLKRDSDADLLQLVFQTTFTDQFKYAFTMAGERVQDWQGWQDLSRAVPNCGRRLRLERWDDPNAEDSDEDGFPAFRLRGLAPAPPFTYGQWVRCLRPYRNMTTGQVINIGLRKRVFHYCLAGSNGSQWHPATDLEALP